MHSSLLVWAVTEAFSAESSTIFAVFAEGTAFHVEVAMDEHTAEKFMIFVVYVAVSTIHVAHLEAGSGQMEAAIVQGISRRVIHVVCYAT